MPQLHILDNFLDETDVVLNFMQSVNFSPSPRFNFPGERSDLFHYINPDLQAKITTKLFSILQELQDLHIVMSFQRIFAQENSYLNEGWVHTDGGPKYSGILYLNENPDSSTGTTFCEPKIVSYDPNANLKLRNFYYKQFYNTPKSVDVNTYLQAKHNHNSRFTTKHVIENKFNRLVLFPSDIPHKQNSFGQNNYIRYTMVIFLYENK